MFTRLMLLTGLLLVGAAQAGQLLVYRVTEQGLAPYISRVLLDGNLLRLDEGDDSGSYTLFDRAAGQLQNIDHQRRQVLVIAPPKRVVQMPDGLKVETRERRDSAAPLVAGKRPQHAELWVNNHRCRSASTVSGLLPDAAKAMLELRRLLARQHASTLDAVPVEMQDACDLVANIYQPGWAESRGLVLQSAMAGQEQVLVDFVADYAIKPTLMSVPQGYERIELNPGALSF